MMSDLGLAAVVYRVGARHVLFLRGLPPVNHAHNAVSDSPNKHARNESEQRGDDQGLERVKPMKDDDLVDCIQHEGDEKHLAGNSPQVSEHDPRLRRIACKGPKDDRPTFTGIRPSRPDRKKRRHYGLNDYPEAHRSFNPTEDFFPSLCECLSHGTT